MMFVGEVDEEIERERRADPDQRPEGRLAGGLRARLAVEDTEIERECE
jgi:hypothetical protein